jgi:hypothetical protein
MVHSILADYRGKPVESGLTPRVPFVIVSRNRLKSGAESVCCLFAARGTIDRTAVLRDDVGRNSESRVWHRDRETGNRRTGVQVGRAGFAGPADAPGGGVPAWCCSWASWACCNCGSCARHIPQADARLPPRPGLRPLSRAGRSIMRRPSMSPGWGTSTAKADTVSLRRMLMKSDRYARTLCRWIPGVLALVLLAPRVPCRAAVPQGVLKY